MAIDPEKETRDQVAVGLAAITALDPTELIREDAGRDLNFGVGLSVFERIRHVADLLLDSDLTMASLPKLQQLLSSLNQIRQLYNQIKEYSPAKVSDPARVRDSIIDQLRQQYDTFLTFAAPVVTVAMRADSDVSTLQAEARRQIDELRTFVEEQKVAQRSATAETTEILARVRTAAGQIGVSTHSTLFGQEADQNRKASRAWLVATAFLAASTLAFAAYAAIPSGALALPAGADTAASIQLAIAKILIFTVLISAVIWTGRNYRSLQHNSVINRHRQLALTTFETFVTNAGDDVGTKNAVLLRATQAVFDPQSTGYVSQESDPGVGSSQILEIVRGTFGGKSP